MPRVRRKRKREGQARRTGALVGPACLVGFALTLGGCWDTGLTQTEGDEALWDLAQCNLDPAYLVSGGAGFDAIPSISNPIMVDTTNSSELAYLADEHRVVGIVVSGQPLAFPLSALWHHEVLNLDRDGVELVVTHGTLTGSSRVFLRSAANGADFGVSGVLYNNNLLFFDRSDAPSLWAQLTGDGRCGPLRGSDLSPYPFMEVTWAGWKVLHPNTLALSNLSAGLAVWGEYPYGSYEEEPEFFFLDAIPPPDPRLPPKERVLAIPIGSQSGLAFSFKAFREAGPLAIAPAEVAGKGIVVFWSDDLDGASAYWAEADGQSLTFAVQDGAIVDQETGTTWSLLGLGSGGDLDGIQLDPVAEATVAYWGAWTAFYPNTQIGEIE